MTVEIVKLTLGPLQTNCYLLGDPASGDAIVIDPVDNARAIYRAAGERGWTIREILATHSHFDHVMASADLKTLTGAPFRLHALDLPDLREMPNRVRFWLGIEVPPAAEPDGFIGEGDSITAGSITLDVLFTPGHSPGHVSFVLRGQPIVFSGDVLFAGGIGRYDLPGADYETLMQSITGKLLPLGDHFTVMPGHMDATTIGHERRTNAYILADLDKHPGAAE